MKWNLEGEMSVLDSISPKGLCRTANECHASLVANETGQATTCICIVHVTKLDENDQPLEDNNEV